jgi:hypothetical protein
MATHRLSYLRKMGLDPKKSYSLEELSNISGVPETALNQIYARGMGAYSSQLESVRLRGSFKKNPDTKKYPATARLSPQQWAMARVYSFLNKGKTYSTADSDIARRYNY